MSSRRDLKHPILLTRVKQPLALIRVKSRSSDVGRPRPPRPAGLRIASPVRSELSARLAVLPPAEEWPDIVEISHDSDHNFFTGFLGEPQDTGLFVATYDAVPLGHRLAVRFTIQTTRWRSALHAMVGFVKWIREYSQKTHDLPPGLGLQFLHIDGEALAAVARFMLQRDPIFWET